MKTPFKQHMTAVLIACTIVTLVYAQPGQGRRGRGQGPAGPPQDAPRFGQQGPQRPGPGQGQGLPILRALRQLDLTQEQRDEVRTIVDVSQEDADAAMEAMQAARTTLHEAVINGSDEETVRAAATALGKAIGDEAVLRVGVMAQIKEVLTEEQRAELQTLMEQMPQGQRPRRGRGPNMQDDQGQGYGPGPNRRPGRGQRRYQSY
jgi:Spy/CpxP family protein refolding chaperone